MPVTFTALGSTLNAYIVDDNFATWQDLFRSGLVNLDAAGQYDRYRLAKYSGGRIVSVEALSQPYPTPGQGGNTANTRSQFDLSFRPGANNPADIPSLLVGIHSPQCNWYAMELLGAPGPSLYHTWQEEGRAAPVGAAGWPPSYWPIDRYPAEYCYSRWLTVPGACTYADVPGPAVIRVRASAQGALNFLRARGELPDSTNPLNQFINDRKLNFGKFALVVDTNPGPREFTNTNPNILNADGTQASTCTWKILTWRCFYLPQRATVHLEAFVAVAGNRRYNFSFKYMDALTHGWVDTTGPTWVDDVWEYGYVSNPAAPNLPVYDPAWVVAEAAEHTIPQSHVCFNPSWVNLWDTATISAEIDYGRDDAYATDSSAAEFYTKAI